ncbi:ABC transporter permease [Nocardiopsis halophila]|uniref:ABC transporter permease n=1 Tax=Nocardiopsis halophila TaxID=141692 RepID=UPI00037C0BCE|nr:ABC transporter permease [Nocardiopsis halophila]
MSIAELVAAWFADPATWTGPDGVPARFAEHTAYSAAAMAVAAAIAVPLGLATGHTGRGGLFAVGLANVARALPTIGVMFLVVLLMGIGLVPVQVALVVLAVPPILVNTYEGVRAVDPGLRDAAAGMGMRGGQVLLRLELPVALPMVLVGLRTAAVQVVSTATIAAYVGVGGLGRFIFDGQNRQEFGMVAGGSLLVALMAVLVLGLFWLLRRLAVAPGLRAREAARTVES